jgi:hypothetical protein
MLDLTFRQIAPGVYQKWNALMGIRTTVTFSPDGKTMHVRHDQPKKLIRDVLNRNVALQNSGKSAHANDLITPVTSMPITVHKQVMQKCGFKPGQGYDVKKFRQIVNDRDYYKLKTVPGRI